MKSQLLAAKKANTTTVPSAAIRRTRRGRRPRLGERRQNRRVLARLRRKVTSLCAFVQLCASGASTTTTTEAVGELPDDDGATHHHMTHSCRSPPPASLATVATHFGFRVAACRAGGDRWRPLSHAALQLTSSLTSVEEATPASTVESQSRQPTVTSTESAMATEAPTGWTRIRCGDTEAAICLSLFDDMPEGCGCGSTRLTKGRWIRGGRAVVGDLASGCGGGGGGVESAGGGGVGSSGGGLRGRRRRQRQPWQRRRPRLTVEAADDTWDLPQSTSGTIDIEWPAELPENTTAITTTTTKHESPITSSATPTADEEKWKEEEDSAAEGDDVGPSPDFAPLIISGENHVTVEPPTQPPPPPPPRGLRSFRRRCLALTERLRSALAPASTISATGTRTRDLLSQGAGVDCRESADTLSCVDITEGGDGGPAGDLPGGRGDIIANCGGLSALDSRKAAPVQIPRRRPNQLLRLVMTTKSRRGS